MQKLLFSSQLVLCGRAWIDLVGLLLNFMFFSFCLLALNTKKKNEAGKGDGKGQDNLEHFQFSIGCQEGFTERVIFE